jgi:hypothetical protein
VTHHLEENLVAKPTQPLISNPHPAQRSNEPSPNEHWTFTLLSNKIM